jgi:nucleoid-associated protein YgaU
MVKNRKFLKLKNKINYKLSNFLIGLSVFVILLLIIAFYLKNNNNQVKTVKTNSAISQIKNIFKFDKNKQIETNKYIVKQGDSLWIIAEQAYGSGYNAYDIAKANNIKNPDQIEIGQNLIIPDVKSKEPTIGEVSSINSKNHTISYGETLWSIAQNVYGDPYKWIKIAEFNNISNPDLIFPNTFLLIP